jgi:hypothetical protein
MKLVELLGKRVGKEIRAMEGETTGKEKETGD